MSRTKKWFAWMALLFIILLAYASYDIGSRTSFPGSKSQLKERLKKNYLAPDTLQGDSTSEKSK